MYFSLLGHVHHFFYLGHQFWAVNQRWFFSWAHQADLGVGMGYRLGLYARWCAEILGVTWFSHFSIFQLGFQPVEALRTYRFRYFNSSDPHEGPKIKLKNQKSSKLLFFTYFCTPTTYRYVLWHNTVPQNRLCFKWKIPPLVDISDSKLVNSQRNAVT